MPAQAPTHLSVHPFHKTPAAFPCPGAPCTTSSPPNLKYSDMRLTADVSIGECAPHGVAGGGGCDGGGVEGGGGEGEGGGGEGGGGLGGGGEGDGGGELGGSNGGREGGEWCKQ